MDELTRRSNVAFFQEDGSQSEGPVSPGVYIPKNKKTHRLKQITRRSTRIISKNGEFNIGIDRQPNTKYRITNWFITMVEARWRWTLLNFFLAFTADWLFFGTVYWLIALRHGDLEEDHLPTYQNSTNWIPCVENIYGFTSSFLFSIEVHTTVAYGNRAITLECPQAIIAMCLQCILSSIFQAFMVGILFAKLTRPKARTQTILFSKHTVISLRDEKFCLVFRVGDMRKSRILNINALAYIIKMDNNVLCLKNFDQIELKTELDGNESSFFLWPVSVVHIIDENSPLYKISAADLLCGKIEILVVFEGMIETTGQPVQARSSYTEHDMLWGHRFVPMVNFVESKNIFDVDFSKLSSTEQIDTPLCSAAEYDQAVNYAISSQDSS
ncbi:G protein-activated inward rectifier potassium channel 4-like [Pectinophora gossypiella]|uniref:G protein-activated inward rectifier potassium channel 4-like n=1 Tax=Pectinophora gossypiella TaxID=13191 RepID=UPI00214E41D0|nr:G protein-activated inward rectifier potassium channel 4-like [Pectinophora gossypiella]